MNDTSLGSTHIHFGDFNTGMYILYESDIFLHYDRIDIVSKIQGLFFRDRAARVASD